MSEELFRLFSIIGIGVTFLASLSAVVVSLIGIIKNNRQAKMTTYNNVITAQRLQKEVKLREAAISYATQITRLCSITDDDYLDAYKELTKAHYAIVLSLATTNDPLHDDMSHIRALALNVVQAKYMMEHNEETDPSKKQVVFQFVAVNWWNSIHELKETYEKGKVFTKISEILKEAWDVSRQEAAGIISNETDVIPINNVELSPENINSAESDR